VFLSLAPFVGLFFPVQNFFLLVLEIFLLAFSLTGLGFSLAWRMDSIQGFHAIMNLFLMPLWFLSGAAFPPEGAPGWLRVVMAVNPLSYGLRVLQENLFGRPEWPSTVLGLGVSAFFAAVLWGVCLWSVKSRERSP
jgi:ABC-2 type transport system permease protein